MKMWLKKRKTCIETMKRRVVDAESARVDKGDAQRRSNDLRVDMSRRFESSVTFTMKE